MPPTIDHPNVQRTFAINFAAPSLSSLLASLLLLSRHRHTDFGANVIALPDGIISGNFYSHQLGVIKSSVVESFKGIITHSRSLVLRTVLHDSLLLEQTADM